MFKLASNLSLAASAATDTAAFFGTRGSGKTYAAGKMVEAFHDGGVQVVVVDPVGVWYGLRLAADGRGRGLDIPVFGGIHGDVPLEPTAGELVAKLVVERRTSVVLDVSMFTLGQQHKFVLAFSTALFNLKKASRSPIAVVFDEAHEFVPQNPGPAEFEMLGAVRRLWKMGRNFGIGVSLISPRPAEVNKGVVNLTERMYCGRLKGAQDRKALEGWASAQDADMDALDGLAHLPSGELLYWSEKGTERVHFLPKRTFDSSKTPEAGDVRPAASLPKIDLEEVRVAMAATIEEAKANDPKALRAEIAHLKHVLDNISANEDGREEAHAAGIREASAAIGATAAEVVELRVFVDYVYDFAKTILARLSRLNAATTVDDVVTHVGPDKDPREALQEHVRRIANLRGPQIVGRTMGRVVAVGGRGDGAGAPVGSFDRKMVGEARRCLAALAQHGAMNPKRLALLAGYAPGGSSFRKGIGQARTMGWAEDVSGGLIAGTAAGRAALGTYERLPTGRALLDYWLRNAALPGESRRILKLLIDKTSVWTPKDIEVATGYVAGGSSMRKGIGRLRSLELVDNVGDGIRLADDLLERRAS